MLTKSFPILLAYRWVTKFCKIISPLLPSAALLIQIDRHIQLLENDRVLVVIDDNVDAISIFVDNRSNLANTIFRAAFKSQIPRYELGHGMLLAFDETSRALAYVGTKVESPFEHALRFLITRPLNFVDAPSNRGVRRGLCLIGNYGRLHQLVAIVRSRVQTDLQYVFCG